MVLYQLFHIFYLFFVQKKYIINKFTLNMCFCVCNLMLYALSYIENVIKYSFHLLLDIQRHNMYWEDYMAKMYYDPSATRNFTGVV